jgi:hypothetical protein
MVTRIEAAPTQPPL